MTEIRTAPRQLVTYGAVEVERRRLDDDGQVAMIIWLNRPDALNALNDDLVSGLSAALRDAECDSAVRTVLITGRGRAFCAGGDLHKYLDSQRDPTGFPATIDTFQKLCADIRAGSKPVVALVNGIAVAGGLELILGCDFAMASVSASIGDCHLNFGQIGGGGALAALPRMVGPARARELIFSARRLNSTEAVEWGLVSSVHEDDDLIDAGLDFARGVAAKSALAVANAKYVLNTGWAEGGSLHSALRLERERTALYCLTSSDPQEGLRAFAEKRKPHYRGN